jgi:exopolysaccharide production protein ExoY
LLIALVVHFADRGPALFGQTRIGRGGQPFRCFKFRSMVVDADAHLDALLASDQDACAEWRDKHKLCRDPRTTQIGALLRRLSLDELPQLVNVIRGDMSLVGPRPIVPAEIARYGSCFREYCVVRPGLSGLWQISGRNDISYQQRVALDVFYVERRSLYLYFRILALTFPAVLRARGAS